MKKVQMLLVGSDRPETPVEVESVEVTENWIKCTSLVPLGLGGPWERRTTYTKCSGVQHVYISESVSGPTSRQFP